MIDAQSFIDVWGAQAGALGWTVNELFGLDQRAPLARYDNMGLCWLLQGRTHIIELNATHARLSDGLTFYRHKQPAR
jgi:hypothetical protein